MALAANQMPIMTAARRTGATWLTRERPIGDRHSSPIPCSFRRPAPQSQARWRQGKLLHFRKRRRAGVKRDSEVPDTQFFAWLLELAAFSRLFVGRKVASCIV